MVEGLTKVPRAAGFGVLAMSGIACLRIFLRTRPLERVVTTSDLHDYVGERKAQCSVESCSVMIAASMFLWDEIERVQCSPREEGAKGERGTMQE